MTAEQTAESTGETRPDDGQVMVLIIFFALIIAALITVVVDVSTVFLAQREMQATADGAALAAAQQADVASVYGGGVGTAVPLAATHVRATAVSYATAVARVPHECASTTYAVPQADLEPDGQTVTVSLSCKVPLPFVNVVARLWSDGVTIRETSHARAAVSPPG